MAPCRFEEADMKFNRLTSLLAAACMTFTFQIGVSQAAHSQQALQSHINDYLAARDYEGAPGDGGNMWHRKNHKHEKYSDYERNYLSNHNLYALTGTDARAAIDRIHYRGYHLQRSIHVDNSKVGYYWNQGHQTCIAVKVKSGKIASIVNKPDGMCGR